MAWPGFFQYTGTEILNASRVEAYAAHANLGWFKAAYGETDLAWLLGENEYSSPLQDDAPWTDPKNLTSYDFYGVYPLSVTGVEDSTISANVVESIIDGGYIGRTRRATRPVVFSAVLVGADECAVEYGMRWLRSVLYGNSCFGQTFGDCGGGDLCFVSCVPVVGEQAPPIVPGPVVLDRTNLATNPSLALTVNGWGSNDGANYAPSRDTAAPISGPASFLTTRSPSLVTQGANGTFEGGNITGFGGLATMAASTAHAHSGTGSMQVTYGTAPANYAYVNLTNLVVGQVYTAECWMYVPAASIAAAPTLAIDGGSNKTPVQPVTTPDTWVKSSVTFTATVASDYIYTPFCTGTPAAGQVVYVDDVKVYQAPNSIASSCYLAATPVTPGPVTLGVTAKTEQANRQVDLIMYWMPAGTYSPRQTVIPATTANTNTRGHATFTAPAGTTSCYPMFEVLQGTGAPVAVGERVWLDDATVEQATTDGTYFDGDTPDDGDYSYSWTGAASASTSQRYVQTYVPGTPPGPEDCYAKIGRSLHDVTTTTGPSVTQKLEMADGGCAWSVTWTMVASNPIEFGVEKPLIYGFMDPDVDVPFVGGVVPDGGTFDEDGYTQQEQTCPRVIYAPVYDPACSLVSPPPGPPNNVPTCFTFPVNYKRYSFTIPSDEIPLWMKVVPVVQFHAKKAVTSPVRLRYYADVFNTGSPATDPCNFCGDMVVTYIPQGATLVIDGTDQQVYLDVPGVGRRRADALITDSSGNPFEWPEFSCGFGYVVTVDMAQQQASVPVLDMSLVPRVA
jgi:hypothetical protein